jgi:hypothetical protein
VTAASRGARQNTKTAAAAMEAAAIMIANMQRYLTGKLD